MQSKLVVGMKDEGILGDAVKAPVGNITTRGQAEEQMVSYRSQLEAIFNCVPEGIVTVDRDMRILQLNEAFKGHRGITAPILNLPLDA